MRNRLQEARNRNGGTRPPTIRDIARDAGVSVATVSRVLNRHPHVAPETRDKVLNVMRELHFSTNRTAPVSAAC